MWMSFVLYTRDTELFHVTVQIISTQPSHRKYLKRDVIQAYCRSTNVSAHILLALCQRHSETVSTGDSTWWVSAALAASSRVADHRCTCGREYAAYTPDSESPASSGLASLSLGTLGNTYVSYQHKNMCLSSLCWYLPSDLSNCAVC